MNQSLAQIKASRVSGASDVLFLPRIHPAAQKADSEDTVLTGIARTYVACQRCGTSRTSPDLLLKPSDLTMELKICMRDGDEVTTLIISRTLPIALGITFRPA